MPVSNRFWRGVLVAVPLSLALWAALIGAGMAAARALGG